MAIFPCWQY